MHGLPLFFEYFLIFIITKMYYLILKCLLLIYYHQFICGVLVSNANEFFIDDEGLVAIAKGPAHFEQFCTDNGLTFGHINQPLAQNYENFLGILHFLRMNWECEEVMKKMKKQTSYVTLEVQQACGKSRQQMFILYEYLFQEFAAAHTKAVEPQLSEQIPVVLKPKFTIKESRRSTTLNKISLAHIVIILAKMHTFLFDGSKYDYNSFCTLDKHQLSNADQLIGAYEINFNISSASAFQPKKLFKNLDLSKCSNFDNSYGPVRKIFEDKMRKLMKKIKPSGASDHLLEMPTYGIVQAADDSAFLLFLRDDRIIFDKFCNKFDGKNLFQNIWPIVKNYSKDSGNLNLEETKNFLAQQYRAYFGILYLMREKVHCEKQKEMPNRKKCEKCRKYLGILFEYLLRVYNEEQNPALTHQFPAIRPMFTLGKDNSIASLINVLDRLGQISASIFDPIHVKTFPDEPKLISTDNPTKTINQKIIKNLNDLIGGKSPKRKGKEEKDESSSSAAEGLKSSSKGEKRSGSAIYGIIQQQFINWLRGQTKTAQETLVGPNESQLKWKWLFYGYEQINILQTADDNMLLRSFVQDRTNFAELCKELENLDLLKMITFVTRRRGKAVYDSGETVEYLRQQFEAYLGIMHLMRQKWPCKHFEKQKRRKQCEKYKKYVEIVYEYFFRVFLGASKNFELSAQLPAVMPNFKLAKDKSDKGKNYAFLIDVLDRLCTIWAFYFHSTYREQFNFQSAELLDKFPEPLLLNEAQLNLEQTFVQKLAQNFKQKVNLSALSMKESAATPASLNDYVRLSSSSSSGLPFRINPAMPSKPLLLTAGVEAVEQGPTVDVDEEEGNNVLSTFRKEFDEILEQMAKTAKNFETKEGFGTKKELLALLFVDSD